MKKNGILVLLLMFFCMTVVSAFAETKQTKPAMKTKPLYERLGGKDVIKLVVDEFVTNVKGDKRISTYFSKTDINKFKASFTNQLCQTTGGPCKYEGKNMKEIHTGMGITGKEFEAVIEDLGKAIDKAKVGQEEKKELLSTLNPMKSEIVEKEHKKVEEKKEKKSGY